MSQGVPAASHGGSLVMLKMMRGVFRLLSRTAPAAASRLAADLFMRPRRFPTPARESGLLEGATAFDLPLGAATLLKGWRWGDGGPTVILVHGWEGRGSQMAAFAGPLVAAGFSVIAYDAPGHGASAGARSSLPHFTWALRCVASAVGRPHAVIAHSLGCAAATLALRDGMTAERLVYVAPPLDPTEYTLRFGEIFGFTQRVIDGMKSRIEERFLRTWTDYSLAETARMMDAELLVVHDRRDTETYWSEGAALTGAWPGARMITTDGLGHRRVLRDPSVVEAAVRFIRGDEP